MNQPRFLDSEVKERVLTMEGKFTLSLLMTQSKIYHFILFWDGDSGSCYNPKLCRQRPIS